MQHTCPTESKSGLTIIEHRNSLKVLNYQKSMPTVTHKINLPNRIMGGADKEPAIEETLTKNPLPESVQEMPNPSLLSPLIPSTSPSSPVEKSLKESTQLEENFQNKQLLSASGPCCFCIRQTPASVGDRKVDEIIEYVHQNLKEAGKALATLGENFEHDLKLMFVNILGRIKQWTGIVQNKLDACKNEVDNLRKELLARACEIDVKTRELKDLKTQIAGYQNGLLLNSELPKKDLERLEQREASIREDRPIVENAIIVNAKEIMRADKMKVIKNVIQAADEEDEDIQTRIVKQINRIKKINARKNATQIADQEDEEGVQAAQAADRTDEGNEEEARAIDRIDEEDEEKIIDRTTEEIDEDEEESLRRRDDKRKMKGIVYTSAAVQTVMQEKERTKRESELESEVRRLRKEYDRAMKERAQYENAIQRALLRGVSSLNVEALRVLRCPPIPCCTPCVPCPATAGIIPPQSIVPCPGKSMKRRPGSAAATVSSAKVSRDRNIQNDDQIDCTTKRPSTGPCCFVNRNRKSMDDDIVFLLHQSDAKNLDTPDEVCGSTIMKKIEIPPLPRFGI